MKKLLMITSCALATMCCSAAGADDQQSNSNEKQSTQSSGQGQANLQLTPTGWVQMAVDYDNDGIFDAIETIYAYDFEKARKSSQERASRDASNMSRGQKGKSRDTRQNPRQDSSRQAQETVSGELLQLRDEQLLGMDEPSVVARIRKENNMPAKAVLGPKSRVDSWKLAEGDEITVKGQRGRINDRPMLLASEVSWGDQTKQVAKYVDLPSSRNAKRVKAEVLSMRTTEFKGRDGKFVVAKVRSQSGKECEVNMGASSKVDQLALSQGDEVRMIVRPAKVNGRSGMVAEQIRANGKTVEVSPPKRMGKNGERQSSQGWMNDRSSKSKQADNSNDDQTSQDKASQNQDEASQKDKASQSGKEAALGIAVGETGEGVVIIGFHPQSPLLEEDVRIGDTVESINGEKIESPQDLVSMVGKLKPGKSITITTSRDGESSEVSVKLTTRKKLMQEYR